MEYHYYYYYYYYYYYHYYYYLYHAVCDILSYRVSWSIMAHLPNFIITLVLNQMSWHMAQSTTLSCCITFDTCHTHDRS
jgi:hypothetical protein